MSKEGKFLKFGHITIEPYQIFYQRKFVFGFVNLKPFLPGHVLLAPTRIEKKFSSLTETEAMEIWISAKKISDNIKKYYNCDSVQISIQDGEDAGQSIPHCHIHILPIPSNYSPQKLDNESMKPRTKEDMAKEAEEYRENFNFN